MLPALWYLLSAGLAVLLAVASFLPDSRLWGVNHLAFQPPLIRAIGLLAVGISFIPLVRRAIVRCVSFAVDSLRSTGVYRLTAALVPAGAFVLFMVFPAATRLLGDGQMIGNSIEKAFEAGLSFRAYVGQMDRVYPGTELLNYGASSLAARIFSADPILGIRTLAAVCGGVFVWSVLWAMRRTASRTGPKTMVMVLTLISGGIVLFFGYVEAYAPMVVLTVLYVFGAKRALSGKASIWIPVACALAAVFMHLMAVLLLPSVFYLVLLESRRGRPWERPNYALVITAAITAAGLIAAFAFLDMNEILVPLRGQSGAFSPAHLVDILNETLLLFPGFIVIVFAGSRMTTLDTKRFPKQNGEKKWNAVKTFELLVAVPALVPLLLVDPKLGMARDWDLFVFSGIGLYTLAAMSVSARGRRHDLTATSGPGLGRRHDLTATSGPGPGRPHDTPTPIGDRWAPLIVITAVLASAWIGVNANPERSVKRYESILEYDKTNAAYAYENLAAFYRQNGDMQRETQALENALAASPNPRYLFVLGTRYYHMGETDKAFSSLRRALKMRPDYDRARRYLVQMLYYSDQLDDLFPVCEEGEKLSPNAGFYPYFIGKAYLKRGDPARAIAAFDEARQRSLPADLREDIDQILGALDQK